MAETRKGWTLTKDAPNELREPTDNVKINTPDPRKYHVGDHATMIPVSCTNGSSGGFDCNKPGKVTVVGYGTFDPITGEESVAPSVTVDYSKLTAEQLEDVAAGITFAGVGSVHKPPRDDIANAFESLAKQQAIQVSFLRRCLQAAYKFLFTA